MGRVVVCLLAASASGQSTGSLGEFTNSADIGEPPLKGAAGYDTSTKEYTVTGTGSDIWARADQFHYLWREMTGNFAIAATVKFLSDGNAHRKAAIMLRQTADTDSPFVHLAIHGDGMPAVQFRGAKADTTNTVDFPVAGPGTWKIKLMRTGGAITVWSAKEGEPLKELGHSPGQMSGPVLAGLGVSSHTKEGTCTVAFSDVTVQQLPPPPAGPK